MKEFEFTLETIDKRIIKISVTGDNISTEYTYIRSLLKEPVRVINVDIKIKEEI